MENWFQNVALSKKFFSEDMVFEAFIFLYLMKIFQHSSELTQTLS